MQQVHVTYSYPLHLNQLGPVGSITYSIPTAQLSGNYLLYAFLLAIDAEKYVNLDFLLNGNLRAVQVRRSEQWQDIKPSSFTEDDMRAAVQRRFGDQVQGITRYVFGADAQKAADLFGR